VVSRSRTAGASSRVSLTFLLNGMDLTRQSVKETQMLINEMLGVSSEILSRTIFHGQHAINGLLEATDARFKQELSLILPLTLWQKAAECARSKGRSLLKEVSEVDGMLAVRSEDFNTNTRKCEDARNVLREREFVLKRKEQDAQKQIEDIKSSFDALPPFEGDDNTFIEQIRNDVEEAAAEVQLCESLLDSQNSNRDQELNSMRKKIDEKNKLLNTAKLHQRDIQVEVNRREVAFNSAQDDLNKLKKKWNINDASPEAITSFTPPQICPTCKQPITEHHTHDHLKLEIKESFDAAQEIIHVSAENLSKQMKKVSPDNTKVITLEKEVEDVLSNVRQVESFWQDKISNVQHQLKSARMVYLQKSEEYSIASKRMQCKSELITIKATLAAKVKVYQESVKTARVIYNEISQTVFELDQVMSDLKAKKENTQCSSKTMSSLAANFGPRGVQTFILQNAVNALQLGSQSYLDELSGNTLHLKFELDTSDRISRTAEVLSSDGTWIGRGLSSLSGGQWRRCSLALSLAFSDLLARRGRLRSSILVLDEPLTHLDSAGRDDVGRVLRRLLHNKASEMTNEQTVQLGLGGLSVSTILIILQDLVAEELAENFDCIDEVTKTQGNSELILDGTA